MGNKPSSIAGSPVPDDASTTSISRKPLRMLRKSSTTLFKRMDSKSPLPRELTASTVLHVTRQVSPVPADDSEGHKLHGSPAKEDQQARNAYSPRRGTLADPLCASTWTQDSTLRPLSSSTTIRGARVNSSRASGVETRTSFGEEQRLELHRGLTLSPSIPAPSPVPEDTPHKYGLKDRMETPEIPEPEKIEEAKSLQSASSFLNGLSTSRRRAESGQRSTETSGWTNASYDTTRPSSSRLPSCPSSTRPVSSAYCSERRRGHTFKPSGFAYTLPLSTAQVRCYRNHTRLMTSGNKSAPVECSVCHIDDDQDHFSCSWCALRMCRFCRRDFAERGMTALRERIKQVELGDGSPESSVESFEGEVGRGRRAFI